MRYILLFSLIISGCTIKYSKGPHEPFVKSLFHTEFKCNKEQIAVKRDGDRYLNYIAEGCGKSAKYICHEYEKPPEPTGAILGLSDCTRNNNEIKRR